MKAKVCKQCGELKPIEQYRHYYGGRKGTYTMCLACERINSREKYLSKKAHLTDKETTELSKIHQLYEVQRTCGLNPPKTKEARPSLDDLIEKYSKPLDLQSWLTEPLTRAPEYYIDIVYEALKRKYRPIISIDQTSLLPIYNESYKQELDQVLERFYTYEEAYYDRKH